MQSHVKLKRHTSNEVTLDNLQKLLLEIPSSFQRDLLLCFAVPVGENGVN